MRFVRFVKIATLTLVVTLALPSRSLASDALEELKVCARIDDDSVRIATPCAPRRAWQSPYVVECRSNGTTPVL